MIGTRRILGALNPGGVTSDLGDYLIVLSGHRFGSLRLQGWRILQAWSQLKDRLSGLSQLPVSYAHSEDSGYDVLPVLERERLLEKGAGAEF